jgi:hypothetical protein
MIDEGQYMYGGLMSPEFALIGWREAIDGARQEKSVFAREKVVPSSAFAVGAFPLSLTLSHQGRGNKERPSL